VLSLGEALEGIFLPFFGPFLFVLNCIKSILIHGFFLSRVFRFWVFIIWRISFNFGSFSSCSSVFIIWVLILFVGPFDDSQE
jgi:hypothetical protein